MDSVVVMEGRRLQLKRLSVPQQKRGDGRVSPERSLTNPPYHLLLAQVPLFSKGLFSHGPLIPSVLTGGVEFSGEMTRQSPLALEKMTS